MEEVDYNLLLLQLVDQGTSTTTLKQKNNNNSIIMRTVTRVRREVEFEVPGWQDRLCKSP